MLRLPSFLCLVFIIFITGCKSDRWQVDVDEVKYEAAFDRLDKEVFAIEANNPLPEYQLLEQNYGEIFSDYIEDILRIGKVDNPMTASLLMRFTNDAAWAGLQGHVETSFPDMDAYSNELELGLRRYAIFFEETSLPRLVAYNSGFNVGIYPSDTWLGVGLEWYAGTDHKWVKQLPPDLFPQYKRDKMKPEYLVPNALRGWLFFRFREMAAEEELLAQMIFAGKATYLTQALLQYSEEQRVMNYTDAQMKWCRENEYDIWKSLVERDVVFSTDAMEINKMTNDGPFTPGMPVESPGGVGRWIGYRMVWQYMDKNRDVDLRTLMLKTDKRIILKQYKPGR